MKKTFVSLLTAGLIAMTISCNSDDDATTNEPTAGTVTAELMEGKWYFVDTQINGISIPYNDHEDCGKDYLEFKADGTLWQIDVWDCELDYEQIGTYAITDGDLYMNGDYVDVTTLTANALSITIMEDVDEDGTPEEVISNFDR
ncbi:Lipocalin-like domain-containing protein [Pustulibacterium marinum]|uniref:Lipocalin-like domain-containing protein n=1 Tax=Pustulibacterium marinum TaxID=1224947 RepID=A0A1I7G033_9FLAO|nr:lipocalin family protein [Pustulibacterium marinum]SFU41783.1 Lipocalin-like domain-containing protein [Pustulibacterium marinum]